MYNIPFEFYYCRLINGITDIAAEVSQIEFENLQFEPPLKVLQILGKIIHEKSDKQTEALKCSVKTQTNSVLQIEKSQKESFTQTESVEIQEKRKRNRTSSLTKNGTCQTNLNLMGGGVGGQF